MGNGDWNDGMNRVGHDGKGESVWMAWFLGATLADFAKVAEQRGDGARAGRAREESARLGKAVDADAWDGGWYRRGYFDAGQPLGSKEGEECRIDAIAQSWAVISGLGDPERAKVAMQATTTELVKPEDQMILLFTPPFAHAEPDPGYIKSYPAGLRENGGQYTHGATWTVLAEALLGEGDEAARLFAMLNPIEHAKTPEAVARYKVEPYVMAADVYSAPGHVGRGGWTWYTGSAAWMYRVCLESMLGLTRHGDELHLAPCIPASWPRYAVTYRFGGASYRIAVENPEERSTGRVELTLDGQVVQGTAIPLRDDGKEHAVRAVLRASARS
jgi:cyclic beta-1,2-glucan synthetase